MNKLMGIGLASAVAVVALPFSLQANAAAMPEYTPAAPVSHAFNGFYLGVGIDFLSLKKKFDYEDLGIIRGGEHTFGGHLLGGYGATFDSFYLGGEIFGKYAPASNYATEDTDGNKLGKITTDFAWGGDLRLGYLSSPSTLIYALIGAESTKFEVKNLFEGTNYKFDKTKVAVMPGAGIETMLADNVSLRAQYTYSFYGNFKKSIVGFDEVKVTPDRSDFAVDLTYQF